MASSLIASVALLSSCGARPHGNGQHDAVNPGDAGAEAPASAPSSTPPPAVELSGVKGAMAAISGGDLVTACRVLEAIPADDPDYHLALHNLGVAYEKLGRIVESRDKFRELTELAPDDLDAQVGLSWAYYLLGDFAAAEETSARAVTQVAQRHKGGHIARYNLALFQLVGGRELEAMESYRAALAADESRRFFSTAERDLSELADLRPDREATHYALSLMHRGSESTAAERGALEAFLAARPHGPLTDEARSRLAELPAH